MTNKQDASYPKSAKGKPVALEARGEHIDGRRFSPSVARNRDPITEFFREQVITSGHVLEIASGTGEHGAHLTDQFHDLHWTYSDIDPPSQESQSAWRYAASHTRLYGPLTIDATNRNWGEAERPQGWDALVSINMIHIAPFSAVEGLIVGAGRLLKPGGKFFLYGPFARDGKIAPSNAAFSESLQSRDPGWGVRDIDRQIIPLTDQSGLALRAVVGMPAHNLSVVFERKA